MTVSIHNTYRRVAGASRTRFVTQDGPPPLGNFFDELNPHLRNAQARAMGVAERITEYLNRRPGRTPSQIARAVGMTDGAAAQSVLEKHSNLYRREGRLWFAVPAPPPAVAPQRKNSRCWLADAILAYIVEHGPATATEISRVVNRSPGQVSGRLKRGVDGVAVVGTKRSARGEIDVWGLTNGVSES